MNEGLTIGACVSKPLVPLDQRAAAERHEPCEGTASPGPSWVPKAMGGCGWALLILAAVLFFGAWGAPLGAAQRQNVLFIAVDDLKPLLGCYGADWIHSPNIDRLAARGVVFSRSYCQQALCGPTRASLLTGLRPDSTGIYSMGSKDMLLRLRAPEVLTLPGHFTRNGYHTRAIGKIFDPRNVDPGHDKVSWSEPYLTGEDHIYDGKWGPPANGYQDPKTKKISSEGFAQAKKKGITDQKKRNAFLETIPGARPVTECMEVPDNAYADGAMTLRAVQVIQEYAKQGEPFFFAVGLLKPHLPFVAPKKYWDLYDRSTLKLATNTRYPKDSPSIAWSPYHEARTFYGVPKDGPISETVQRELLHGYAACVSYIDAQVGKLLEALEQAGIANQTIICLWGDHGWHLGDKDEWGKHTNYEEATHTALIISAPGMPGGTRTASLCEFVDIYPTLCDLAGLSLPAHLEGKSLVPLLREPGENFKEAAISQFTRPGAMGWALRTERYRYVEWRKRSEGVGPNATPEIIGIELYDYSKDPLELQNHARQPEYGPVLQQHQMLFERLLPRLPKRSS